ncbi:MAG: efflux RND transporter permease subunit [Treponema sp.]|jgi:multidrug efflux pump subunit AcrB|nr:efflux RND transporter permease subunit [Treponema sp.]
MRGLINILVRRPVTVIMILAAQIIAAIFSLFTLPINRLPDFSVPRVTVETLYLGMAANEIRSMVTIPLEDGLSPIKGLEKMRSVSRDNRSLISLDFRWGTDPMSASVLVREAVDAVYPGLPEGVRKPLVTSGDSGNEAHAVIAVSSLNGNGEFARKLAEYEMQARLRRIDGVGSVILVGGEIGEERLSLDVQRLAALGLSPSDFTNLLAQQTADIPAGNAREGNMELVVVNSGKPDSTYAFSQIILPVANGTLRVEDTGELYSSTARRESIFIHDGKEATALEVYRRPGADPLRLSREIKKTLDEAASLFSRDAQILLVTDSSSSLISGITGLIISAALGAVAVAVVLLLFIRRLQHSLLAAFSILISVAAGICVLSVMGKSLNSMSLSGLAMGIGLVSDISVIVLDMLHRTFGKRETAPEPEEIGNKASSIAGSSIASTLTTALVFIPIIMLPGALGSLFGDIAIALVASVTAGWLYAQFCLPSLYLLFFNSSSATINFKLTKTVFTNGSLVKKYAYYLGTLLRRPTKFFIIAVMLSALGFFALFMRPVVFLNSDEAEEVWVSVIFPPGTLFEMMLVDTFESSNYISGLPFVKTVYGRAGAEEEDVGSRADIDYRREEFILRCVLEKGIKPEDAISEISSVMGKYSELPFSVYFPRDRTEVLLGLSTERTFVIKANDREELLERIETAKTAFSSAEVNFRPLGQRPELRLYPNRETSAYLSMPATQIAETLFILNEGVVVTQLEVEGNPLDVRVIGKVADNVSLVQQLEQIPLRTSQGKTVFLGSLGRIEQREADASLARLDRSDVIYVDFSSEKENQNVAKDFTGRFSWLTGADESVFSRYRNSLILYVFLVLILLYMTMGAQFESFLLPLILMMSIPLSLAGAGPALLITGKKIDSGAILGLTALFGLVVNNSLVLFEVSEQKIRAGLSVVASVYRGACERLQAILIIMITTIIALLPLVFSPLGNSQKSMAVAMLGGLAASTLLSLFAIPPVLIRYLKWKLKSEGVK